MKFSRKAKMELTIAIGFMIPALVALYQIQTRFVELDMNTGGGEQNAALFPRILSTLLLLLSVSKIIEIFLKAKITDEKDQAFALFEKDGRKRLLSVFAVFMLYVFGLSTLGFYVGTPLILILLFIIMGIKKPLLLILYSVAVTLSIWYVFGILLKVILPVGKFGLYF